VTLLVGIPGVSYRTAQVILAEIGTDMSRFPTAGHLASWAGMCPGNNEMSRFPSETGTPDRPLTPSVIGRGGGRGGRAR
jgi:hypothetical protein